MSPPVPPSRFALRPSTLSPKGEGDQRETNLNLIFRFFIVLFAFFLASIAAAATLVFGATYPVDAGVPAHENVWPVLWFLTLSTSAFVAAFAFAPSIVVILVAEAFSLRSVLFYAITGGAVGLFCGYTLGFIERAPDYRLDGPFGSNFELMAAAGIAGGLVYWLTAGRSAGAWRGEAKAETPQS